MPCSCKIGQLPTYDAEAISAALLNGDKIRHIASRFPNASRTAIGHHRKACLGITGRLDSDDSGQPLGQVSGQPDNLSGTISPRPDALTHPQEKKPGQRSGQLVPLPSRRVRMEDAHTCLVPDARVRFIARLIENHQFFFRPTIEWLGAVWKLSSADVRVLYREALDRVSTDRKLEYAELEVNLAALEQKEHLAMREFRRLRLKEVGQARNYLSLALKARMEYATIAGLRREQVDVSVNVWNHPSFLVAVDTVVETSLDASYPQSEEELTDLIREAETKLGRKIDPDVAVALLEVAARRVSTKLIEASKVGGAAPEEAVDAVEFPMSHSPDPEERPRGKRVKNPVSADLWYEEQSLAEQQRLAARVVVSVVACLKDVNLPEEELRGRLLSLGRIENLPVLLGENGTVDACDAFLNVADARLTEDVLCERLREIGRVARVYLTFEGTTEEEAR